MSGSDVGDYVVGFVVFATNVEISKILDRFFVCVDVKQLVLEFELDVGSKHCLPTVMVKAAKEDPVKLEEGHLRDNGNVHLNIDWDLGRDLVQDLDLDLERDLERDLGWNLDLDLELNLDLDLGRNLDLDLGRNLELDLERNLDRDLGWNLVQDLERGWKRN